jgi:hypothetical protein
MRLSAPFALITLFLAWIAFIGAAIWCVDAAIEFRGVYQQSILKSDSFTKSLLIRISPGLIAMAVTAYGGVLAEMSLNQKRYQAKVLEEYE